METRAGYMMVGTFVLLSLIGIFVFFLWVAKTDLNHKTNFYTIYFQGSVTGLSKGGTVSYLGVPIGMVKDIELEKKDLESVKVTVSIKGEVPIKEDAYASLEIQGLTGYKFVQIYGGCKESPNLTAKPGQQYPVIPSRYSGVEEIMTTLPRMVNKFTNLIDRMNATFNEQNRNRFSATLKHIDLLSERLAESSKPLKALIEDSTRAMQTFNKEVDALSASTQKTLEKIDTATDGISNYLERNKTSLDTITQSGSYELVQTLHDLQEMTSRASHFFEKLEQNPRNLLFESQRKGISLRE
jgi:phospholipid/cholesterol/gamma-HCH transport system substrate-binding protein